MKPQNRKEKFLHNKNIVINKMSQGSRPTRNMQGKTTESRRAPRLPVRPSRRGRAPGVGEGGHLPAAWGRGRLCGWKQSGRVRGCSEAAPPLGCTWQRREQTLMEGLTRLCSRQLRSQTAPNRNSPSVRADGPGTRGAATSDARHWPAPREETALRHDHLAGLRVLR